MDSLVAEGLATKIKEQKVPICRRVSARLLSTFPELTVMLKLEGEVAPETRLSSASVERLAELIRGILIFETFSLAEQEFRWAAGVLPRHGVNHDHQATMVRWFFGEVYHLDLNEAERALAHQVEQQMLDMVAVLYKPDNRRNGTQHGHDTEQSG